MSIRLVTRGGVVASFVWMTAVMSPATLGVATAQSTQKTVADLLRGKFAARLQEIAGHLDGVIGYSVLDLTSNDRLDSLERHEFPAASTIKIGILYEFYRQAEAGTIRLDEKKALDPARVVGGSGVLKELGTPVLSLQDYGTLMILLSDNTATNIVIDLLGLDAVNGTIERLGATQTRLRRRMMDTEAARRGDENTTTTSDLAMLLEASYRGRGLSSRSRDSMLSTLKKAKRTALVRGLPAGIDVASKSGELEGVRGDCGIVFAPNRPYIIVVLTTLLHRDGDGEQAIEDMSRTAYEYFSRLGAASPVGRLIDR